MIKICYKIDGNEEDMFVTFDRKRDLDIWIDRLPKDYQIIEVYYGDKLNAHEKL